MKNYGQNDHESLYYRDVARELREVYHISWRKAVAVCGMSMMYQHYRVEVLPSTLAWKIDSLVKADRQRQKDEGNV